MPNRRRRTTLVPLTAGAAVASPILSGVSLNDGTDVVTFTASKTCTLFWLVNDTAVMLDTGVADGGGLAAGNAAVASGTADITASFPGVSAESHWLHFVLRDSAGRYSTVSSTNFTKVSGADVTPAVLTGPTGTSTGATTGSGNVSTDEIGDRVYRVTTTSSTKPTPTQVYNAQNAAGTAAVANANQAVTAIGLQTLPGITGLTEGVTYYNHFTQRDNATNLSLVVTSGAFVPAAAASWAYDGVKGSNGVANFYEVDVSLSGITAGQKLFAFVSMRSDRTITAPAGWTLYQRSGAATNKSGFTPSSSSDPEFLVYSKTASGSETNVVFGTVGDSYAAIYATVIAMTGSGQVGDTAPNTSWSYGYTSDAPSIAVSAGAFRVCGFTSEDNANSFTALSGGTTIISGTAYGAHMLWIEGPLSAGTAATKTATQTAIGRASAISVELEPV